MKKTATTAGSGQQAKSDPIVTAASQAVLDLDSAVSGHSVTAERPLVRCLETQNPSVSVAAGSDETAQEPVTLLHEQVREGSELDAWQRLGLMGAIPGDEHFSPSKAKDGYYNKLLKIQLKQPKHKSKRGKRKLGFSKAVACFDRCVVIQAKRERNSLRRRARLLNLAKALDLSSCLNRQEIAQRVLEAKDQQQGHCFQLLSAADRLGMKAPSVVWLIRDAVPAGDLTIIGGRPKVGKTRLAVSIAAAVLKGGDFLGFGVAATRPVVLVTDDQADGDTYSMLQALQVWDHPGLKWSRHFRFTESDIQGLLDAIKANPGALVVIDSLRSVSRSLPAGENDPEIGAYLYDLKQAVIDAGGTLLLIHHCNKAADLVGVEALSGHNTIAGAANTVLTLHYCPDANGKPDKTNPQRRLVREARSGEGCDLVIDRGATAGTYRRVAVFDQWQQQINDAKEASKADRLSEIQEKVLETLSNAWMTRRQVCEAIGVDWGDRGRAKEPKQVGRSLQRLVGLKKAESRRAGVEDTYRLALCSKSMETLVTLVPSSNSNGSPCHQIDQASGDSGDNPPSTARHHCHQPDVGSGDSEKPHYHRRAPLSPLSLPLFTALADQQPIPVGSGADAFDDGDDPAWG